MTRNLLGSRLVTVGDGSLAGVTGIDTAAERRPAEAGLSAAAVDAIWGGVEGLYRSGAYPAVSFCLRRRGAIVLNRSIGYARGGGPGEPRSAGARLAEPDTPICLFSASKAITAILVHKLAEEGGVDLDARVSHYLPEFTGGGKDRTTIAQVLSHRGGFPMFNVEGTDSGPETLLDWDRCIRLICEAPAEKGGKRLAYHAITGGFILAEVIQRVTGMSFRDYLDTRLRKPLGMRYFTYGLDRRSRGRVAHNYVAGQPVRFPISVLAKKALSADFAEVVDVSNRDYFMDAVVPAGNLYSTAEELSRFYQMMLDGGMYEGRQILAPETIRRAIKPAQRLRFDHTLKIPMRYSEGLMLGVNPFGLYGPMTGAAYGHLGFMNILGWADPSRDLSASLLVTGKAILGGHLLALGQLLSTISWQCRG
ncbi:beta-lactamase family protein [Endozoicomonas sp. G2_2]|uniref:serine hydrolase domain-containing protein n=1 Tax=Endozoicomonas sp. G2_2 TaxID=2821092 RepID=UPI001AD9B4A1|nr:serine hydrolase domain-containing protein [Endozoicomonas sp. G2_2]MBO9469366.1 beta-lactamase family protein [Endozoicomonas sp. G2_2]